MRWSHRCAIWGDGHDWRANITAARGKSFSGAYRFAGGRNEAKLTSLIAALPGNKTEYELVDLSSIIDLVACTKRLSEKLPHVDALINNAAAVPNTRMETVDNLEMQFATNVSHCFTVFQFHFT